MDIQQAINLAIKEVFEKAGIEFAFPTQTIHLSHADAPSRINGEPALR
jgi:small-conductance mechanosensitive channel